MSRMKMPVNFTKNPAKYPSISGAHGVQGGCGDGREKAYTAKECGALLVLYGPGYNPIRQKRGRNLPKLSV